MFVTVFLAYYDAPTGRLTYASGGHNPLIIIGPNGDCREFGRKKGVALGFRPGLNYNEGTEILEKGEILVLYTDGVTEAFSPQKEMFGQERFQELLCQGRDLDLEGLSALVGQTLEEFQQGNQFDDITILLLRRER